jgi:hypothetical protein
VAELVRNVDVQKKFFQPDDREAFLGVFKRIYDENTTKETMHIPA